MYYITAYKAFKVDVCLPLFHRQTSTSFLCRYTVLSDTFSPLRYINYQHESCHTALLPVFLVWYSRCLNQLRNLVLEVARYRLGITVVINTKSFPVRREWTQLKKDYP